MFERTKDNWRKLKGWYREIGWAKRRVVAVVSALGGAWLITFVVFYFVFGWAGAHKDELFVGTFAAWTGELVFFSLVGAIITVVTLRDPSREVYDERVRILFGSGPESVLNYNKRILSRLSAYTQRAMRTITIESFDPATNAYRVKVKSEYHYKNLLHDVDYDDTLPWNVSPDRWDQNPPAEIGRIMSIRIDGNETIQRPQIIGADGYTVELKLAIPPAGQKSVTFEYWVWMKVGEVQELRARRCIEQYSMSAINQSDQIPRIEIDADQRGPISLLYNQPVAFNQVQGISPGERVFVFKLLPPAPEG
jgi:hypothetical protein